jgi:hypothetical protein
LPRAHRAISNLNSWEQPGRLNADGSPDLTDPNWKVASFLSHDSSEPIGIEGCDRPPFEPSLTLHPSVAASGAPSGYTVDLHMPQRETPAGIAQAALKKIVVKLPQGVVVSPSSSSGLGACDTGEIGIGTASEPNCPDSSKIGTVRITTPLLEEPMTGFVYLAKPTSRQLLKVYLVAEGSGVVIKLLGTVDPDPNTGQLTATFDNNPQLPFNDVLVNFKDGPRAPLVNPPTCGVATTTATFSAWSGATASSSDSFEVSGDGHGSACPPHGFAPGFSAGTVNPVAGSSSPFVLRLTRSGQDQQLSTIVAALPNGLLASLKGIPYCGDAELASISGEEGTGAAQLAGPSCPATSQVGTVTVGAGAGSNPFYLSTGKAYLAGPYKGAPLSLAVVTPALAGPFDLGNAVVRSALRVDPETAQVTAVSDPLPTILHGIPLDLRDVRVDLDRPDFTRNPTSCDPTSVDGTIGSVAGASAAVSDRFQVADCAALGFGPELSLALKGKTRRAGHPALTATLRAKGQANIGRVSVALPHSEFLAQEHIRTVCTRVQFAASACPKASIYGYAEAKTPLLDKPLKGPVYLRSNGGERVLPDLVAALHGQIDVDLVGYIDSHGGGIRTTFQSVPDAPVSRFTLRMKGGSRGLLVNSTNICRSTNRATVKMDGQNGKIHDSHPVLRNSCGGTGK